MITPVRYAGSSARKSHASVNMRSGPTTHDRKSDQPKKTRFETPSCRAWPSSS